MKKLLIIAAMLSLTACSKVTMENYEKIKIGMDKSVVVAMLGEADNCVEKTLHTNCVWGNDAKNIKITLVSNKVTLYSKMGLTSNTH